jgi:hypothetical protein
MNNLIQFIGPQGSGKSTLRKLLCPNAIEICLNRAFPPQALLGGGNQFYFFDRDPQTIKHLKSFLKNKEGILVNRPYEEAIWGFGDFIFIYEGTEPLPIENSRVFTIGIKP